MKTIIIGIVILLTISCNEKPKTEFSLAGTTSGLIDGEVIYLTNADSQVEDLIDSTIVKNNSFRFSKKLSSSPLQVVLRTKDYGHYRFLWLENNPMSFDATKKGFENATVTGSISEKLAQLLRKEIENLSEEEQQRKKELEFIKEHPTSIVSAEILSLYCTTFGKKKTKELFDLFSKENKETKYGKIITDYINLNINPKIGERYVDFEMTDLNGNQQRLSELGGKTILLEFWASWCAPCRKENPNLLKTYKKYSPNGFEIFAVSLDEKKRNWANAVQKDGLSWYHVNDLKGTGNKAALIYGVEGIPDNFLIDKNGTIIGRDLRGKELEEKLSELLN